MRERIVEASAGYPLYVEEMLAMLREQRGEASPCHRRSRRSSRRASTRSTADVRVVLERGAIEGEVFHRGAVVELVPEHMSAQVESHLASLIRRELIWPERALTAGEEAYRFRHILVRDAASTGRCRRRSARTCTSGSRSGSRAPMPRLAFERDEIVGYHLEQALLFRRELGVG